MIDFFETLSAKIRFQKPAFWTVKVAFLSVGIILLKLAVSYYVNVLSTLSRLWISFNSCLIPPHNLIAVIFTIIAIKVSSSLHPKPSEMSTATKEVFRESENFSRQQKSRDLDSKDSSFNRPRTSLEARPAVDELSPDFIVKFLFSVEKSSPCLTGSEEKENPNPPVSAGFPVIQSTDTHRKTVRSTSPAPSQKLSKPNTVAKPEKQNDTLDSRGKAISDGRGKILRGHLEKRKTWDVPPPVSVIEPEQKPSSSSAASNRHKLLRKSETFNVRASSASSSGGDGGGSGLRRGKSLSHDESSASSSGGVGVGGGGLGMSKDELYWQSEEFIKKFRQQMTEERLN